MFSQTFPLWPARASSMSGNVDALFIFLLILCGLMCFAIFTLIMIFAVRYHRRAGHEATPIEGSTAVEIAWTTIPFGIFLFIFAWGAYISFVESTPPKDSSNVYKVAK